MEAAFLQTKMWNFAPDVSSDAFDIHKLGATPSPDSTANYLEIGSWWDAKVSFSPERKAPVRVVINRLDCWNSRKQESKEPASLTDNII